MILPSRSHRVRPAYTLLEVTLAAAIGVLIMYGLYTAIDVQISSADAGREKVEQATLARSLLTRIGNDITPCVGLADAGRYRRKNAAPAATTTPSTTTPSTTPTTEPPATTTPMTGTDMTGTAATDPAATTEEQPLPPIVQVIGDSTTLTLFVTRLPPNNAVNPQFGDVPVSDQRRIIYWMASGETGGLARQEIPLVTADSFSEPSPLGTAEESRYIIAEEVQNIGFEYFDGSAWQTSWDGQELGTDGKTPKGPPLAIRITLELAAPNSNPDEEPIVKTYTHTVSIPTANGLPQPTEDPTMMPTMP